MEQKDSAGILRRLSAGVKSVGDYLFRNHGYLFFALLLCGPVVVVLVNYFYGLNLYEGSMLFIGWNQAVITGFLSFKIYAVSRRDSELPKLAVNLADVEELESPYEDHMIRKCIVDLANLSHGRAKVTDVDLAVEWDKRRLQEKDPAEGRIISGFPPEKQVPFILDKGEKEAIEFQINGYNYLEEISLVAEEKTLGTSEHQLLLSDITDMLLMKRSVEEDGSEIH
jgi:hypothetical protein